MNKKNSIADELDLFAMRNMRLEDSLIELENNGVEIGHINTLEKEEIVDPELVDLDIRKAGKKTSEYFNIYYCMENTIRRMIKQTMEEKHGIDWWRNSNIPEGVKNSVSDNIKKEKDSLMTSRSLDDPLQFATLGELSSIILENWDDFSEQLKSKKAVSTILFQLNQIRVAVAHSNKLSEHDANRLEILVKDWQYQQG
ncbi:MAG: hypothetical protein IIC67_10610 [Thaumarchaeota archaeon]|nr:hypothetical protein [Nitrososphaerota archaeon]